MQRSESERKHYNSQSLQRFGCPDARDCGDDFPSSHFGKSASGMVIIMDEDPKETEFNSWIPTR